MDVRLMHSIFIDFNTEYTKKNLISSQNIPKRPFDKPKQSTSSGRSCRAKARHKSKIYSEEYLQRHEEIMNMGTTVAAVEDINQKDDVPQFLVLDYPDGITDLISLDWLQGFKPGFAITVVAKTCDVFKFAKNCVILNSYFCGWGPEERTPNMPIRKNEKFSLVCTYEEDGYRVFIDGVQIAFYKHCSTNPPKVCDIGGAQIFKVIYEKGQPLWVIKNTTLDFGPLGIPSYTTTLPQLVPGSWISMSGL
ncbi:hypothetical protein CBL_20462, partial [Carabus blaptoides fortunei]